MYVLNNDIQFTIDKLIEARGLSKTWVAKNIGVSRETVYNLDTNTKLETFLRLCDLLKISINDLLYTPVQTIIKEPETTYNAINTVQQINLRSKKTIEIDLKNFRLTIK